MPIHTRAEILRSIKSKVVEEFERGHLGPNTSCEYYPCHHRGQDCTYCYCPFYPCNDPELGTTIGERKIWDCSYCIFIHRKDVCEYVSSEIEKLNITDPEDERLGKIFKYAKENFFKPGRTIMVVGATSDAGKSLITMALCRIISNMGSTVTPMKTQNMSLNSVVIRGGSEVAMIQYLQSKAAGLTRTIHHINPLLIKPMGDMVSHAFVHGRPYGIYDVLGFYNDFIPGPGKKAAAESIKYLRHSYDYLVIEGAGSPAEINIYDNDIANMRAAEMAEADCILVVNTQWGGSFAYAAGTVELLEPKDRKRIKAILFNNLYGSDTGFKEGVKKLEKMIGIPVLGVVPHIELSLPSEDSTFFRNSNTVGNGKTKVVVVLFPKISNFNDIDPLYLEDTTVIFADTPEDIEGADAIIIPGTKNVTDDMLWMRSNGMEKKILEHVGKVPVLGICGGYQIMSSAVIEKGKETPGMNLFDNVSYVDSGDGVTETIEGELVTGGAVRGFTVNTGSTKGKGSPLFLIHGKKQKQYNEGSFDEKKKLFGTYMHGVFDATAFRDLFLKTAYPSYKRTGKDFNDHLEENIEKLAEAVRGSIDMELFKKLFMGGKQ